LPIRPAGRIDSKLGHAGIEALAVLTDPVGVAMAASACVSEDVHTS